MSKLTISKLAAMVAKKEGKKKQVSIAQISEIIGIISDLSWKKPEVTHALLNHGKRRASK